MQQTFSVPEVSCGHCKSAIEGALNPLSGVTQAVVAIDSKKVDVDYDPSVVSEGQLVAAIQEAGYDVAS